MKWVTWFNMKGARTSRAHVLSQHTEGRTECGYLITSLVSTAGRHIPRCNACLKSTNAIKLNGGHK